MILKNKTYSSYYIDLIKKDNDLNKAVYNFRDKIENQYEYLLENSQIDLSEDLSKRDLSEEIFGPDTTKVIVGEFDLSKHISGHGPTGEIIINEPTSNVPEKVFEEFINLVDPKSNIIFEESILSFAEKYGLLFFDPNEKLINEKYHTEELSIWKQEISLMHSLTKLYYYYTLSRYDLTRNAGIKGMESLFLKKNNKQYYFDDSYKSMINEIKDINFTIDGTAEFEKKNKNKNIISYEQLIVKLFLSVLKPRLKASSHRDIKEIQISKKYSSRDYVWFGFEKYYNSLYNYIWSNFANFVQDKGTFKICSKCNKYFVSKVIQRGRFCSDTCRASRGRELEIWASIQKIFRNKGYETFLSNEKQFSRLVVSHKADTALYDVKSKSMVALLEFKYSDINNQSPKFKFFSNNLQKGLKLYEKYFGVNNAFVINKNKQIFFWDLKKKIFGEEIKSIPNASELNQSTLKIDAKIEKNFYLELEQEKLNAEKERLQINEVE